MSLLVTLKFLSVISVAGLAIPASTSFFSASSANQAFASSKTCYLVVKDETQKYNLLICVANSGSGDEYYSLYNETEKSNKKVLSVTSLGSGKFSVAIEKPSQTITLNTSEKQLPAGINLKEECISKLNNSASAPQLLCTGKSISDFPTLSLSEFKEQDLVNLFT